MEGGDSEEPRASVPGRSKRMRIEKIDLSIVRGMGKFFLDKRSQDAQLVDFCSFVYLGRSDKSREARDCALKGGDENSLSL